MTRRASAAVAGLAIVLGILLLLALALGVGWFRVFYTGTVGAAQQNAERVVFEHSRSYVLGKTQELAKLQREYDQAEPGDRLVLAATIRHQFADIDAADLPNHLAAFLHQIRNQ